MPGPATWARRRAGVNAAFDVQKLPRCVSALWASTVRVSFGRMDRIALVIAGLVLAASASIRAGEASAAASPNGPPLPVIHCTDLLHPYVDPDDHFDLATLYAIQGIDLKAVILDQGRLQAERPGTVPVSQMNRITGRDVPAAIGLAEKLRGPEDKALDQEPQFQRGVELMLATLRRSPVPVAITAVGSMRDVTAAFNREPELFRTKVAKLMVFIGEASDPKFVEYNVSLDPQAYVGLMRSGLPIYWVPCFDGGPWRNQGHASFWQALHKDLLKNARPEVLQYFIYALEKEKSDPVAFLSAPIDPERKRRLLDGNRNLWCTAVFERLVAPEAARGVFGFAEADITLGDDAVVRYGRTPSSKKVMRFEVRDSAHYAAEMTAGTERLLSRLGESK
jgi:pyrimidine-specific ribonucleoside hydrolase